MDRTLPGATPLGQSGPGSDSNEKVLPISKAPALLKLHVQIMCHIEDTL